MTTEVAELKITSKKHSPLRTLAIQRSSSISVSKPRALKCSRMRGKSPALQKTSMSLVGRRMPV